MNIPSFENYQCVPKDFTGFWWNTKMQVVCYCKNGEPENIFGAAAFLSDGRIQKILRNEFDCTNFPQHKTIWKQFNKDSPEAKYSWSLFKFYLILDL